jgi:hypothetical protein
MSVIADADYVVDIGPEAVPPADNSSLSAPRRNRPPQSQPDCAVPEAAPQWSLMSVSLPVAV